MWSSISHIPATLLKIPFDTAPHPHARVHRYTSRSFSGHISSPTCASNAVQCSAKSLSSLHQASLVSQAWQHNQRRLEHKRNRPSQPQADVVEFLGKSPHRRGLNTRSSHSDEVGVFHGEGSSESRCVSFAHDWIPGLVTSQQLGMPHAKALHESGLPAAHYRYTHGKTHGYGNLRIQVPVVTGPHRSGF